MRMSTFSCSTSRRASSTALSGVASDPPYDDLDRVAGDDGVLDAVGRIAADRSRAPVDERQHRSAPRLALERGERAFVVREDADLDRPRRWPAPPVVAPPGLARPRFVVAAAAARGDRGKREHEGGEQDPAAGWPALSGFRMFPPLLGSRGFPLSPGGLAGAWLARVASSFVLGDDGCVAGRVALLGEREGVGSSPAAPAQSGTGARRWRSPRFP